MVTPDFSSPLSSVLAPPLAEVTIVVVPLVTTVAEPDAATATGLTSTTTTLPTTGSTTNSEPGKRMLWSTLNFIVVVVVLVFVSPETKPNPIASRKANMMFYQM
uniref:Uncharacterized protein n=1 Tax=Anopheles atroparvus TaxID=41427 RepID=A0A182INM7_ANOAO